jgi:cobalt-precorrin 5A hydrolase
MTTALITLSNEGVRVARRILTEIPDAVLFTHRSVDRAAPGERFDRIAELTARLFPLVPRLVYICPCGVAVRAIAPHVRSKLKDAAVVAVDVAARWVVSLLSGHEGGANDLAVRLSNVLFAEPVITTTTEAVKDLIVGIGCRRGVEAETVIQAAREALERTDLSWDRVRLIASVEVKRNEVGLIEAAARLGIPLRFISLDEIRTWAKSFEASPLVQRELGVPAVAEPTAMLAGRRTTLVLKKQTFKDVTVAVAKESFGW